MIFHCQRRLASSTSMPFNPGIFHVRFCPMACHGFGRPQTWSLNIYNCVGTSLIGWFDDKHTLPHDFLLPDLYSNYYGHAIPPLVFPCLILSQGLPWVWKASNMGTKHIYLCVNKFNWVVWCLFLPSKWNKHCIRSYWTCVQHYFRWFWFKSQGLTWVWKASNMGTKYIYLCGNKFNWVVWW